ncbi:prolyl oligopeptidase family serine peptidase [Granulicella sibirica]|uniref:Acylamino-acid-releasing enzyme n=1 Tax=Granulicella sibirica TaxID=2479048 RepID=A0A4Q0SXZ5_9BACT|nr:prolyl oligopeptidase family serine peptidase [Granulicella sibirica]RXH53876.1 Acylamino-acid-releasing enzyme [Granulicella sibirica]
MNVRFYHAIVWLGKTAAVMIVVAISCSSGAQTGKKRAITVDDAIRMTRLADPLYFGGAPPGSYSVAQFSPDKMKFVIVLRTADTRTNTNIYKMYLFSVNDVFDQARPNVVCQMSSSSNTPAISEVRWLNDNRRLVFLGARALEPSQVYIIDTSSRRVLQRTHHQSAIDSFDISADGRVVAFSAEPILRDGRSKTDDELIVNGHSLIDVLTDQWQTEEHGRDLFIQTGDGEQRYQIPPGYLIPDPHGTGIWMSPNGTYAAVALTFRRANLSWAQYDDKALRLWGSRAINHDLRDGVGEKEIFILDTKQHELTSAVGAPASFAPEIKWSPDGWTIYMKTFLPPSQSKISEPVEVNLRDRHAHRLTNAEWSAAVSNPAEPSVTVDLEEDPNSPPRIFVASRIDNRRALLIDLNPQFRDLEFGEVRTLTLSIHGVKVVMGLYLPPDYRAGKRYPLVIQTHGFDRDRFSMDGMDEWSTGFAARPLAANGFIVLQTLSLATPEDAAKYQIERSLGRIPGERAREMEKEAYEAGIDTLDAQGFIDRKRVGISGFSISVMFTAFTLTHSNYPFAAAALADGVDEGYFLYVADEERIFDEYNDGSPFTIDGLSHWLKDSPSFSFDKVHTPVRLVARDRTSSVLEMWEWYAALDMQDKPVDFISLRGAAHTMERPSDRCIAMDGLVDWFSFWLQDYEDPSPNKREQYLRWKKLRRLQHASEPMVEPQKSRQNEP